MIPDPSSSIYNLPAFNPRSLRSLKTPFAAELNPTGKEMTKFTDCDQLMTRINQSPSHCIVFIGLPGAGKSTFFNELLSTKGYFRINRDELGTMDKCTREFEKYVKSSTSNQTKLVIDNLNVDLVSRGSWLSLCKVHNLTPIAFQFNISREHAIHNNNYRRLLNQMSPNSTSQSVPEWLISKHSKNLVQPTIKEGFSSLFKINFSPNFGDRDDREIELYYMYLNEK
ncbi:uncharacterized protein F21D5.5-like [Panonychus citri]|nr:uncharacterized protein F21D5.5-like [Panonychus citri]